MKEREKERKRHPVFFHTRPVSGLELTFWSGVYTTSVGNTQVFGDEGKRLIGLVGIFTGVGEIVGGAVFGFLGKVATHVT